MSIDRAFYIRDEGNGTYTAFVVNKGFRAHVTLASALAFIRENTGRKSGAVDCFDAIKRKWVSEFDLREGV